MSHLPSLDFIQRRIGELSRELQLLRSLRRILQRYQGDCEAAKEIRSLREKAPCQRGEDRHE